MARLLGFSLGSIWRWAGEGNAAELLGYARQLGIDGIELNFSQDMLLGMRLDGRLLSWLRKLSYVSVHAPFELQKPAGRHGAEELASQLDRIWDLYRRIRAKNFILHPSQLPGRRMLDWYGFSVSTENMSSGYGSSTAVLKKVMRDYPDIRLCLDVSHAFSVSGREAARLVAAFEDRISQVHLSCTCGGRTHQPLGRATKAFMRSIEPVKRLRVPFIVEEDIRKKDMERVKDELRLARSILDEPGAI